jgi:2'-5' RNA ligase
MDAISKQTNLSVFPPEAINDLVDVWRRTYTPSTVRIAPHITLVYPPFIPQERWPLFRLELNECLAGFSPFDVSLNKVESFPGNPLILWLKPEDNGQLALLRKTLETQFPNEIAPFPIRFQPHLTIGLFEDPVFLAQAFARVQAELIPMSFQVDRIFFCTQVETGQWWVKDYVQLGKT